MTTTTANANTSKVNNGVNVDALLGAREALEQAPEAAQFKWRATCEWVNGTHSRSVIDSFFGLGAEQSRDKSFTRRGRSSQGLRIRRPRADAGRARPVGPCELPHRRHCRRRPAPRHPAALGQGDRSRPTWISHGILGIDEDVRNGFGAIRVHFDIKADASQDDIKALVAQSQKRSAVFDIITNPTNVFVTVN